jgi:hypothetical protein
MRGAIDDAVHRLIGGLMALGAWFREARGSGDDVARRGLWGDRGVQDPGRHDSLVRLLRRVVRAYISGAYLLMVWASISAYQIYCCEIYPFETNVHLLRLTFYCCI